METLIEQQKQLILNIQKLAFSTADEAQTIAEAIDTAYRTLTWLMGQP